MNGEVSLIVRVEGAGGPGDTVIDNTGGYVEFGTYTIFMLGDMTVYIGHYVQITSTLTGVIGTFELATATYDGTTWSTVTFVDWTPIEVESLTYEIYSLAPASQEYYLDLWENESISQNWQYSDLNNFQALGAFSREFRVPVTDRNLLALGALFDVNYDGGINNYFHYKLPAEIRVDTLPIAKGYIRVRKVYQQQGRLNEVELAFYAETPDLFKTIGEKKLAELSDLPNQNEVVNFGNITVANLMRQWVLTDRGQLWSEEGQAGTRRISDSSNPLYAVDFTPAVRWDYLLKEIMSDAGFELDAPDLLLILAGYHMPWINKSYLDTDDFGPAYAFRAYNLAPRLLTLNSFNNYDGLTEVFDNNNDFDPTLGLYTAPARGRFTFHLTYSMQSSGYIGGASRTRVNLFYRKNGGIENFIGSYEYTTALNLDITYGIDLDTGDTVEFALSAITLSNAGAEIGSATVVILGGNGNLGGSLVELVGTQFKFGSTFIYNLNAPDMRQIDFVNDIIKMHNCAIVSDRNNPKKISIVPYNNFIGTGNDVDWNSKLDISKDITIYSTVELQKNKTTFTYTAGEDYLSKLYKDNGRTYGQYKAEKYTVNPDITPSTFTTGENSVQLVTRSMPCGVIPGTDIPIPQFFNDQNEFIIPGPRCGYVISSISMKVYDDTIGVESVVTIGIPTLSHYNTSFPDIFDFDLNFAPEIPPSQINANPYNNLFNLYWRNAFNELYSPNARIMEAYFALDLTDILTFKFSDIIFVNGAQWRILEISDYKVGQFESTKVKLIKFIGFEPDCSSTPESVSFDGTVNFVDNAGNPVEATASCCTRYGYNWNETTDKCYAFNNRGGRPVSGVTGTSTNQLPRNTSNETVNSNTRSVQQGVELAVADGNNNTLAVGDTLKLDTAVAGNAMVGKNVMTSTSGFHLGGGWKGNDRTQPEGSTQFGVIMHGSEDTLTVSGQIITPPIENIPGNFLVIPDESYWVALATITIFEPSSGQNYTALYHCNLWKTTGVSVGSIPILISEDNLFGGGITFVLTIDTAADPTQHRFDITVSGGGFPHTFKTTLAIQYTAVR